MIRPYFLHDKQNEAFQDNLPSGCIKLLPAINTNLHDGPANPNLLTDESKQSLDFSFKPFGKSFSDN